MALKKVLFIDNFDSFTFNLVQMFLSSGVHVDVHRHDAVTVESVTKNRPDYMVVGPGPGRPGETGKAMPLIESALAHDIPVMGVCLGMQCINEIYGGTTVRAPVPTHGKTSWITHDDTSVFSGLPLPFQAARYHSLMIADVPDRLKITAWTDDVIMGICDPDLPVSAVQFHPESFLTPDGNKIITNFLRQKI